MHFFTGKTLRRQGAILYYIEVLKVEYITITEASEKWGISNRRIQTLCAQQRIPGAIRLGSMWAIPVDSEKPVDARIKSGKYIKSVKNT